MERRINWRKLLSSCVVLVLAPNLVGAFCPTSPCRRHQGAPSRILLHAPEQNENADQNEDNNKDDFSLNSAFSRVSRFANKGVSDVASVAEGTAKSIVGATGSGVKTVAGAATSGVSKLAKKGTTDVVSVASATGSGVQSIAGAAASGASGVARKAASDVKTVADAAGSGVKTVAGAAGSGISRLTETGGTGVNLALSGIAKGSSRVQSVANAAGSNLSQLAERGSLSVSNVIQWLDAQGRGTAKVAKDTAVAADAQARAVAKELIRQTTSADYSISDVLLLLKVLVVLGASFGPLAKLLPVTVLLNMLNVSLEARLGGKILEVLAESLDERFLAAFTAEELGDLAKRSLRGAIISFTGKEAYEQGDIQRAVTSTDNVDDNDATSSPPELSILELSVGPEFAQWDEAFRESQLAGMEIAIAESLDGGGNRAEGGMMRPTVLDQEAARALEEWDRKFRESIM
jgi:hypothetical protein